MRLMMHEHAKVLKFILGNLGPRFGLRVKGFKGQGWGSCNSRLGLMGSGEY